MSFFSSVQRTSAGQNRVHVDEDRAVTKFAGLFSEHLAKINVSSDRPRVIICIGTDRSTGDSLGPLVGTKLIEVNHSYFKVLGTLDNPVHATNLTAHLKAVEELKDPFVIAVDACLGNIENVGYINIGEGALKPGAGVNKLLPQVGNIHITGVVNVGGFMEYFVLQNTRLNIVMKMARIISEGIHLSCKLSPGCHPASAGI